MPAENIERSIYIIRGQKVILDEDLAVLYGISTKRLNEQVSRNSERFPEDFSFQLSQEEWEVLRSQNATSKLGRGGRRYLPFVFTEHGTLMVANLPHLHPYARIPQLPKGTHQGTCRTQILPP